jgi:hypothetical protein
VFAFDLNRDSDNDERSDIDEIRRPVPPRGTPNDPLNPDSDGDGLFDGIEIGNNSHFNDSDSDGYSDSEDQHPNDPRRGEDIPIKGYALVRASSDLRHDSPIKGKPPIAICLGDDYTLAWMAKNDTVERWVEAYEEDETGQEVLSDYRVVGPTYQSVVWEDGEISENPSLQYRSKYYSERTGENSYIFIEEEFNPLPLNNPFLSGIDTAGLTGGQLSERDWTRNVTGGLEIGSGIWQTDRGLPNPEQLKLSGLLLQPTPSPLGSNHLREDDNANEWEGLTNRGVKVEHISRTGVPIGVYTVFKEKEENHWAERYIPFRGNDVPPQSLPAEHLQDEERPYFGSPSDNGSISFGYYSLLGSLNKNRVWNGDGTVTVYAMNDLNLSKCNNARQAVGVEGFNDAVFAEDGEVCALSELLKWPTRPSETRDDYDRYFGRETPQIRNIAVHDITEPVPVPAGHSVNDLGGIAHPRGLPAYITFSAEHAVDGSSEWSYDLFVMELVHTDPNAANWHYRVRRAAGPPDEPPLTQIASPTAINVHAAMPASDQATGDVSLLLPCELNSDLNNDGKASEDSDSSLKTAALRSGASDDAKEKGTEYLFVNDNLSNGLWDKEDSDSSKPANENKDDDITELKTICAATWGGIWFEFEGGDINKLEFWKDKECTEAFTFAPTFALSESNKLPEKLYVRTKGDWTGQVEGILIMKFGKADKSETWGEDKLLFTVVKHFGDTKYFRAARDYIWESNTKFFVHEKRYDEARYRLVVMREAASVMYAVDTYDHANGEARLHGIDAVSGNYAVDVVINGNQCFFSGVALPGAMTNRCDGRFLVGRQVLRPPSDDNHHDLGGQVFGRYVGHWLSPNRFVFGAGRVPENAHNATPDTAMGGLSTNYTLAVRQTDPNQLIGYVPEDKAGEGIVFTATNFQNEGGKATEFSQDAVKSGVPLLPAGDGDDLKLFHLDGSTSVGLAYTTPSGTPKTYIKGSKHSGVFYWINTYLLFECERPR